MKILEWKSDAFRSAHGEHIFHHGPACLRRIGLGDWIDINLDKIDRQFAVALYIIRNVLHKEPHKERHFIS